MSELENRYAGLFGSKTSKGQLQGGFALMVLGALLGLAALTLFIIANLPANTADQADYYNLMKVGLTVGPIGLALLMLGFTVALPTKTAMRVSSYVGLALTLLSALLFLLHYPNNFNVARKAAQLGLQQADYAVMDVLVFVVGFGLMVMAAVTSIIGYYLSRVQVVKGDDAEDDDEYGAGYEIPDWVVEKDIEDAMKRHGVEWGGASNASSDKSLVVNVADTLAGAKIGGLGKAKVVQLDAEQVDLGVKGLTRVRPQKGGALPSEWTDDATKALVAFRKQKQENPKLFTPKRSFWQKVVDFFTGRNRAKPTPAPVAKAPAKAASKAGNGSAAPKRGKTIVIEDEK